MVDGRRILLDSAEFHYWRADGAVHWLFGRFHRATAQPGGAGLGLVIADVIVRSTNGRWLGDQKPARPLGVPLPVGPS
jgi:hypothetical protein